MATRDRHSLHLRRNIVLASSLLLAGLVPTRAAAQIIDDHRHGTAVIGAYLGVGSASISDQAAPDAGWTQGLAGDLRVGFAVREDLVVALETSGWTESDVVGGGELDLTFYTFGPSVVWFPFDQGLYLRGLIGWGGVELTFLDDEGRKNKLDESGWGAAFALGWEFRLSMGLALALQLDAGTMNAGELKAFTEATGESFDFKANWLTGTVGLTLYL